MNKRLEELYKNLFLITEICLAHKIKRVVLSPGSRSAPLALSFMRNAAIEHFIINDERSAAYIALGMAKQSAAPVALVCTSGTAALNYAPAIAEAYHQRIPLVAFTTDRPEIFRGRLENQTIHQEGIYEPNVLKSYQLEFDTDNSLYLKGSFIKLNEALLACTEQQRPVQVNLPINEPLYMDSIPAVIENNLTLVSHNPVVKALHKLEQQSLMEELASFGKIMIVTGTYPYNPQLRKNINRLLNITDIVFLRDITSNLPDLDRAVMHAETILKYADCKKKKFLKPDLLISFGRHGISKEQREYLRQYPPAQHWHIDPFNEVIDPYFALSKTIQVDPEYFITMLLKNFGYFERQGFERYYKSWEDEDYRAARIVEKKITMDNQFQAMDILLKNLPSKSVLHCGNSLAIRMANNLGLNKNKRAKSIEVYANRGTSGIDGCLSTAVGAALAQPDKHHFAIIGDQSYWYDRNALWNIYKPVNLTIFVLNNKGGRIFERLNGPREQPEYNEYFVSHVPADLGMDVEAQGVNYACIEVSVKLPSEIKKQMGMHDRLTVVELM